MGTRTLAHELVIRSSMVCLCEPIVDIRHVIKQGNLSYNAFLNGRRNVRSEGQHVIAHRFCICLCCSSGLKRVVDRLRSHMAVFFTSPLLQWLLAVANTELLSTGDNCCIVCVRFSDRQLKGVQ